MRIGQVHSYATLRFNWMVMKKTSRDSVACCFVNRELIWRNYNTDDDGLFDVLFQSVLGGLCVLIFDVSREDVGRFVVWSSFPLLPPLALSDT